jgi:Zn-dependent peptidase ImmA (M78 family)
MTEVPVSRKVLVWARKFRGLSLDEAAAKLGWPVEELRSYEEEEEQKPTLGKFEKLAAVYQLPQATLFLRTPPREPPMPNDFRTHDGAKPEFGFEFRVALSEVRTLQRTISVLSEEDDEFLRANLPAYDRHRDPWTLGELERLRLGVTVDQQIEWRPDEALRRWRAVIEQTGVSVYLQKFAERDCRGFSLISDSSQPALVINKSDESDNAKVFTLMHEYSHLLIREPGISDLDNRHPVEAFCNRFAAGFLMPRNALLAVLPQWPNNPVEWDDSVVREGARRLKVSQRAFALRLEETGLAPAGFNRKFQWRAGKKPRTGSGGNYIATKLSEIGGHYTGAVMGALDRGVVNSVQASEALGLRTEHFDAVRAYVERQRALASGG